MTEEKKKSRLLGKNYFGFLPIVTNSACALPFLSSLASVSVEEVIFLPSNCQRLISLGGQRPPLPPPSLRTMFNYILSGIYIFLFWILHRKVHIHPHVYVCMYTYINPPCLNLIIPSSCLGNMHSTCLFL